LFKDKGIESLIGSDIDQIVILEVMDDQTLTRLRDLGEKVSNLHVPAESHVFDIDSVRDRYVGYEKTFLEALNMYITEDEIIGKNILRLIELNSKTGYEEFKDRKTKNLRRIARDVSAPKYSKTHCKLLGRLINYTIYSARDMLYLKFGGHATKDGRLLSKDEILEYYEAEFKQMDANPLRRVLELRTQYREFFDNVGPHNETKYIKLLDRLDRCYIPVQKFIAMNLELAKKLQRKQ